MIQNGIIGRSLGLHLCMIPYYNVLWLAWHQAIHARKAHSVWVQAMLSCIQWWTSFLQRALL